MIRLIFEITQQTGGTIVHGQKEYFRKTPMEHFLAEILSPMCSKALKDLATVQQVVGADVRGTYVQGGPEGSKPVLLGETGLALFTTDGPVIMCFRCGRVSHNPHDVEHKYCGHCHIFHEA